MEDETSEHAGERPLSNLAGLVVGSYFEVMSGQHSELGSTQSACIRCLAPMEPSDRYCRNCGMEAASEEAKTETYLAQILPDRV